MLGNIGGSEILVILVVVMLFFGASRLPDLARALGQSAKGFREGMSDISDDIDKLPTDE